jgi:hypothetical protein
MAEQDKREALETLSLSERLLAQILLQLMAVQSNYGLADRADRLRQAGLSTAQAAALLDTTPAAINVVKARARKSR